MRNLCKKRNLQLDKAQGGTKRTDLSGTNAIDSFNYYSRNWKGGRTENETEKSNANKQNAYAIRLWEESVS